MPLPEQAANRTLLHTRNIQCFGYEREDGLWDIEGHMVDTKSYSFDNREREGGKINPGDALHDMWVRLTLDDDLLIHDAQACTDWSPFGICPGAAARYQQLKGLSIGPGWNRKLAELFRGVDGCTHLTDLLGPVATVAYQTIFSRKRHRGEANRSEDSPRLLNSCFALAENRDIVRIEWPKFYTGKLPTKSE